MTEVGKWRCDVMKKFVTEVSLTTILLDEFKVCNQKNFPSFLNAKIYKFLYCVVFGLKFSGKKFCWSFLFCALKLGCPNLYKFVAEKIEHYSVCICNIHQWKFAQLNIALLLWVLFEYNFSWTNSNKCFANLKLIRNKQKLFN